MTPASRLTRSLSMSFRSLVTAVAGWPSVSSRMTSSLRPAICIPCSCQYSSQPLYMSFPAWAMAPEIGDRKPILIGPWAWAGPVVIATTRPTTTVSTVPIVRMRGLLRESLPLWPRVGYMTWMRVEFVLTAVVGLGALSIDMFLPSLPTIAAVFGAEAATAQLTVILFLMAFAVAQLVYGPLSDRFGRRWVLIGGLGLYAVAGLACALAPTIGALIGARVLQALGGGSGPVVARAVIRDLYERERAARVFSYMAMVQSLNPMLAPILGGYVHEAFGWRAIFFVLAGAGALFVVLMIASVPETNVRQDPTALRPGQMGRNVAELLTDRSYVAYVLVNALMFGGQFAFISGSSFVLIEVLGVSPSGFGLCFGSVALGIMTGTFLSGRFGAGLGLDRTILCGTALGAGAGLTLAGLAWSGILTVAAVIVPMFVFAIGLGLTLPNGMAGAVGPFPRMAGLAAAVAGFLQMTGSALYSVAVGHFYDGTARPMTTAIAVAGLAALACFWRLRWRRTRGVLA